MVIKLFHIKKNKQKQSNLKCRRRESFLWGGHLKRETYFLLLESETNATGFSISMQKIIRKKKQRHYREIEKVIKLPSIYFSCVSFPKKCINRSQQCKNNSPRRLCN